MTAGEGAVRPAPGWRILVVEDEAEFAELIGLWLQRQGWQPIVVPDGQAALDVFAAGDVDLVLLDLGLPGMDGWEVLERIRSASQAPILLVTARGTESEKIRGLSLGADDFVTKPLSFPELMARIEAAFRRARAGAEPAVDGTLRRGSLQLDPARHRVQLGGVEIHLSPTEFRLLQHLIREPDRVVGHRELLETVWGAGYADETHLLQVTIRNLRAKLATVSDEPIIGTVYGLGYRLEG